MKIGITGHTNLTQASTPLVYEAICEALKPYVPAGINGVTCLARGADQIFAQAVVDAGGDVTVLLPSRNYREKKVKPDNLAAFDDLLSKATEVVYLPFDEPGRN